MSGRKNSLMICSVALAVGLLSALMTAMLLSGYYGRLQYDILGAICEEVVVREPEAITSIAEVVKTYTEEDEVLDSSNILADLGYEWKDFSRTYDLLKLLAVTVGILISILLLLIPFWYRNRREDERIRSLVTYLEQVNTGKGVMPMTTGEDELGKLEDEIYKTVTALYKMKDVAEVSKANYAENLSNIAHQLKTPITALSLALQTIKTEYDRSTVERMEKQLLRLTHLEEALLLLARLDAGTLLLQEKEIDVFTVLVLAADNLQELLEQTGTQIDIPELGELAVWADLEWTMEAIMNLMKNCMEHNEGGIIHCTYEQNPLYTEILIWDEGDGFCMEDLPHLFERFYRGKNAGKEGIGIGLALAKEIIERQNGTLRAKNLPEGGACFEIRFYCH